jgi:4-azaleucine resistance transporter AzlC
MTNTEKPHLRKKAFRAAFPLSIPVMTGYVFLGMTMGIYGVSQGFPAWLPPLMALTIYGGSLEFVTISMLLAPFAPLACFAMALMIQARHLFYGLAMLDRFKGTGWKKFFLIFWMSDETFAVSFSAPLPDGIDRGWFYFFLSLLDYLYWFAGVSIGAAAGSLIPFKAPGLDFIMTAMFVVIFMDQWLKEKKHYTAIIGLLSAAACRLIFSADSFMIPSMILILAFLTALRKPLERAGGFIE